MIQEQARAQSATSDCRVLTAREFMLEPSRAAEPLIAAPDGALLPSDGTMMIYGKYGSGKTTLGLDLAFCLASGTPWVGLHVPRPVKVLLVEAEGPMEPFQVKMGNKFSSWTGGPVGDGPLVWTYPWVRHVSFASETWRRNLVEMVVRNEVEALLVGPVKDLGMKGAGTQEDIKAFMSLIGDVRGQLGTPLGVGLTHHSKSGDYSPSGTWGESVDTLIHAQSSKSKATTTVRFEKVRWSSELNQTTRTLHWNDVGEGYEPYASTRASVAGPDVATRERCERAVLDLLTSGEMRRGAIVDALKPLGFSKTEVDATLSALKVRGGLRYRSGGYYSLAG